VKQDYNGDYYIRVGGKYTVVDKKDVVPLDAVPDNGKPGDGKANDQNSDPKVGQTSKGVDVQQDYNGDYYTYVDGVATVIDKKDVIPYDQVPDNGKGGDGKVNHEITDPIVGQTAHADQVYQDYNGDYYYFPIDGGDPVIIKKEDVRPLKHHY
jgi:hypothetical protein